MPSLCGGTELRQLLGLPSPTGAARAKHRCSGGPGVEVQYDQIIPRAESALGWRWRNPMGFAEIRFAPDSPLEGGGFEPSVPQQIRSLFETARPVSHHGLISRRGTDGSNPPPSSSESERARQAPVLESHKPRHYPQVGRGHPELYRVDAALGAAPDDAPGYSEGRSYQTRPSLIVSWAIRRRLAVMVLPSLSRSGKFPSRNSNTAISALAPGLSVPTVPL